MKAAVRKPAALSQKEPEDFSADEKEAAQAKINIGDAATLAKNEKTLAGAIKANIKSKQDHINSLRKLGSVEVKKEIKTADGEVDKMVTKRKAD